MDPLSSLVAVTLVLTMASVPAVQTIAPPMAAHAVIAHPDTGLADRVVAITAREGAWTFRYQQYHVAGSTAFCLDAPPLVLEKDVKQVLRLTSDDIIYEVLFSTVGTEMTAIPGRLEEAWIVPTRTGRFEAREPAGRSGMRTRPEVSVEVLAPTAYERWAEANKARRCPDD